MKTIDGIQEFSGTLMDLPVPLRKRMGGFLLQHRWGWFEDDRFETQRIATETILSEQGQKTKIKLRYGHREMWGYEGQLEEYLEYEFELTTGLRTTWLGEIGTGLKIKRAIEGMEARS